MTYEIKTPAATTKVLMTDEELARLSNDAAFRAGYRDLLARQALEPLMQEARKKAYAIAEDCCSVLLEIAQQKKEMNNA